MMGVLAGAAAGLLLGVLLAPNKGSDTRDRIAQLGDDYAGDITDKIRELRDSINERIDALKGGSGEELAGLKDEATGLVKKSVGSRSGHTGGTGNTGSSGMGGGFSSGNTGGGYSSGSGSQAL